MRKTFQNGAAVLFEPAMPFFIFRKDPEILSLVEELIPVILQGIIRKVSLESEDGVKASICLTSSGKITVSRKKMSNRTVTV